MFKTSHYMCPVYATFSKNRISNNQLSGDGQLITTVPIPVKFHKPNFWIKRSICILCSYEALS